MKRTRKCSRGRTGKWGSSRGSSLSLRWFCILLRTLPHETTPYEQAAKPFTAPIHVVVPVSHTPFRAGQRFHLVYELYNSNLGKSARTLTHSGAVAEKSANRLVAKWADIFRNSRIFVTQDVAGLHISG